MLQEFITKSFLRLKILFRQLKNKKEIGIMDKGFMEAERACLALEKMDSSSFERVDSDLINNLDNLIEEVESTLYSSLAYSFVGTIGQYEKVEEISTDESSKKDGNIKYNINDEDYAKISAVLNKWENVRDYYQAEYFNLRTEIENTPPIFLNVLQTIEKLAQRPDREQKIEDIKKRISAFINKATTSKEILLSSNFSFMSPYDFEEFVARLFRKLGYNTVTTSKTGDYGVDVIAENSSEKIAIQCKKYHEDNTVGNQTVQMLLGAMQLQGLKADKGIIVTTSSFTKQAYKQAEGNNIELWDKNILHQTVRKQLIGL